jgi:hypothetical protein
MLESSLVSYFLAYLINVGFLFKYIIDNQFIEKDFEQLAAKY